MCVQLLLVGQGFEVWFYGKVDGCRGRIGVILSLIHGSIKPPNTNARKVFIFLRFRDKGQWTTSRQLFAVVCGG